MDLFGVCLLLIEKRDKDQIKRADALFIFPDLKVEAHVKHG